jgi:hypothetical protein
MIGIGNSPNFFLSVSRTQAGKKRKKFVTFFYVKRREDGGGVGWGGGGFSNYKNPKYPIKQVKNG